MSKCPVCEGTGLVSRPPWIAGDQMHSMINLPEWIEDYKKCCGGCEHKTCGEKCLVYEALSIAWEGLALATRPEGRYSMDHYQHAKNTIEDSVSRAKEAMRRIEEIGK